MAPKTWKAYLGLREALISAAAAESQVAEDVAALERLSERASPFATAYALASAKTAELAARRVSSAIDDFYCQIPSEVLDSNDTLLRDIRSAIGDGGVFLEKALEAIRKSGSPRAWLAEVKRDAEARAGAFGLAAPVIGGDFSRLRDLLTMRNAATSGGAAVLDVLTSGTEPPEPQPFILLCAVGPPGARVVCIIGLAIAIGASSHNVE